MDRPGERERAELLESTSGRGAFRVFRSTIRRLRIEEEWDRFRGRAFERIAIEWLRLHHIDYER